MLQRRVKLQSIRWYSWLGMLGLFFGLIESGHAQRFPVPGCAIAPYFPGTGGSASLQGNLLNVGRLTVDPAAPVGAVLWQTDMAIPRFGLFACYSGGNPVPTGPNASYAAMYFGEMNGSGYPTIAQPVVPGLSPITIAIGNVNSGLGIRWSFNGRAAVPFSSIPGQGAALVGFQDYFTSNVRQVFYWPAGNVHVEIVKTSMAPSSPIGSLPALGFNLNAIGTGIALPPGTAGVYNAFTRGTGGSSGTIDWPKPSCNVTTTNLVIPLGTVAANTFDGVGSTSTPSPAQNIQLTCTESPAVAMSITGPNVPGTPDAFGLAAGSPAAGGVAVQLLYNGTPVQNGGNLSVTDAADTTLIVPIQARYISTGPVTPGVANARMVATFTFN